LVLNLITAASKPVSAWPTCDAGSRHRPGEPPRNIASNKNALEPWNPLLCGNQTSPLTIKKPFRSLHRRNSPLSKPRF